MRSVVLSVAGFFALFTIVSMGSPEADRAEVVKTKERIWSLAEKAG